MATDVECIDIVFFYCCKMYLFLSNAESCPNVL
jgi:hypothetical protein